MALLGESGNGSVTLPYDPFNVISRTLNIETNSHFISNKVPRYSVLIMVSNFTLSYIDYMMFHVYRPVFTKLLELFWPSDYRCIKMQSKYKIAAIRQRIGLEVLLRTNLDMKGTW